MDEEAFQEWYAQQAVTLGLDPDPDNPLHFYDYRSAFAAGASAEVIPEDGLPHFPSEFKKLGHPNLVVEGRDTRTGELASPGLLRDNLEKRMRTMIEQGVKRRQGGQ